MNYFLSYFGVNYALILTPPLFLLVLIHTQVTPAGPSKPRIPHLLQKVTSDHNHLLHGYLLWILVSLVVKLFLLFHMFSIA